MRGGKIEIMIISCYFAPFLIKLCINRAFLCVFQPFLLHSFILILLMSKPLRILILSVRSLLFALILNEHHRSQNKGSRFQRAMRPALGIRNPPKRYSSDLQTQPWYSGHVLLACKPNSNQHYRGEGGEVHDHNKTLDPYSSLYNTVPRP